jgi:hypothetical protein
VTTPSATDFKAYFVRDFPFGSTADEVMDADITKAIADAAFLINEALAGSQEEYNTLYLNLTAHFLVMNLRSSSQGISGQYSFLHGSKGVGSVSESISIPQRILDNPEFAMLCKTNYGAKYVMMILPRLAGQMFIVQGTTQP